MTTTTIRSRAPEFHGFVAWTSTALFFILYLLWALLPDDCIVWLGIRWYPNREWAILIPSWTVTLVLFTYFAYSMLAVARTPPFSDLFSIRDRHSKFQKSKLSLSRHDPYAAATQSDSPPETYDMPIGMINRILYGAPSVEGLSSEIDYTAKLGHRIVNGLARSAVSSK